MGKLIAKPGLNQRIETSNRLIEVARTYRRKYAGIGRARISRFWEEGQKPYKLVIMPALGLREFNVDPISKNMPGEVFTVTCREDGSCDQIAMASIYYALRHLPIREIECHTRGKDDFISAGNTSMRQEARFIGELERMVACSKRGLEPVKISSHYYHYWSGMRKGTIMKWQVHNMDNEATKISNLLLREGAASPGLEALVIECSDSRVMGKQIFEGVEIALVSNWGNVLSPTALDAIEALVKDGLPAVVLLGHNRCDAIGYATEGGRDKSLEPIMRILRENIAGGKTEPQSIAVVRNIHSCVNMLEGKKEPGGEYLRRIGKIAQMMEEVGTVVVPLYLDLFSGVVISPPVEPNWKS
jgi:hypothetical protein